MNIDDEDPILNIIARSVIMKGGIVDVFREGRGILGRFESVKQADGSMDYSVDPPVRKLPRPEFWTVKHSRGCEMLSKSAFENLEVRKIKDNVFHVIIPR